MLILVGNIMIKQVRLGYPIFRQTNVMIHNDHSWKFRSQTSDNMDRWSSRGGKRQRRERKKEEEQRRERVRRKKIKVREKIEKSRNTVFFQCFVAPEVRKVTRVPNHDLILLTSIWLSYAFDYFLPLPVPLPYLSRTTPVPLPYHSRCIAIAAVALP